MTTGDHDNNDDDDVTHATPNGVPVQSNMVSPPAVEWCGISMILITDVRIHGLGFLLNKPDSSSSGR